MHREQITLDVSKRLPLDHVRLRVGEGGLAAIDATILNNGEPYDLTGSSVLFVAQTPDSKVVYDACTITSPKEGKASYTVSKNLTHITGEIGDCKARPAYLRIKSGDNQITTQNIPILILPNVDLDGEQAEEYESQFEELLTQVETVLGQVNGALSDTRQATDGANQAASAANEAADRIEAFEEQAELEEAVRIAAEAQRSRAETQRESAEYSRQQAEAVRESSEYARQLAEEARASEWQRLKVEAETATSDANDAATSANAAAARVDGAIETANKASEAATQAAEKVDGAVKLATDAAGQASEAASVAKAASERTNAALRDVNAALDEFDTIVGSAVDYAFGESSTSPPEAGWTAAAQPVEDPALYLWTRTTTYYKQHEPTVSYSVARQGKDGRDGVGMQSSSLWWLWVDEYGDLYATYADDDNPPSFSYDQGTGNLYAHIG